MMFSKNTQISLLFYTIWLGDIVSTIGTGLTTFCLGVYVFKSTGMVTSTSMVVFFGFLPAFLLRPIGGVLADRTNRLLLMVLGNLGCAASVSLILAAFKTPAVNLNFVYLGLALSSMFYALQNPAYKASVTDFLPKEIYSKAAGLIQLSSAAQFLISPLLGGILMAVMNIKYVLIIDVISFVFSAITVVFVMARKETKHETVKKEKNHFINEFKEGWYAISSNKGILKLTLLTSVLLFYIGLIQALLAPMVLSFTSETTLGVVQSICAVGMLVTSFVISLTERKNNNIRILFTALIFVGLFYSFIGVQASIWAIIIPGFLFFAAIPYVNSSIDVLIRQNIENEKQGRVWSIISFITYIGPVLAYAIAGYLADKIFDPWFLPGGLFADSLGHIFGVGPGRGIAFIFFLSGLLIVVIAFFIYRSKSIWQLEISNKKILTNLNL